jgi:predicted ATPase
MIIKKVEIENFKSFRTAERLHLNSGFNVIIGPNSGGKSALIKAITLDFDHVPHLSTISSPSKTQLNSQPSLVKITSLIELDDIHQYSVQRSVVWNYYYSDLLSPSEQVRRFNTHLLSGGIEIDLWRNVPGNWHPQIDPVSAEISQGMTWGSMQWDFNEKRFFSESVGSTHPQQSFQSSAVDMIFPKIYAFEAERPVSAMNPLGSNKELAKNGQNLPQVLNYLQTKNPPAYNNYIEQVKRVLPDVRYVTVPPAFNNSGQVEILIWNESYESGRDDLAVPLTSCGTGVSQVLALLYVVVTSEQPRTLLIDEPQSFLNPGALRRLLEILGEYPQHQYVLATHSPSLLTSLKLSTLAVVSREGTESKIENLDPTLTSTLKSALNGVGAQLSDVYGADRILWVEGPTEEACFPEIIKNSMNRPLNGTVIIGVKHTGDFEDKNKHKVKLAFEVHSNLNLRRPLLPPALGFVFDLEGRSQKDRDDLERQGQAQELSVPVRFLKRRLYENYLLEPNAIAVVLNADDDTRSVPVSDYLVSLWINSCKWDSLFFERQVPEAQRTEDRWLKDIHGAKLLHQLFLDLTETRVEYSKTKHSVDITKELLKTNPGHFSEITEILQDLLPS